MKMKLIARLRDRTTNTGKRYTAPSIFMYPDYFSSSIYSVAYTFDFIHHHATGFIPTHTHQERSRRREVKCIGIPWLPVRPSHTWTNVKGDPCKRMRRRMRPIRYSETMYSAYYYLRGHLWIGRTQCVQGI